MQHLPPITPTRLTAMNRLDGHSIPAQAANTSWRHRLRLFHAWLWFLRQAILEEVLSFCHFCGETLIMLVLWHCALGHDVDVYDRWFRAARSYLCRHIDVEELTSHLWPLDAQQESPINDIAQPLGSPHVYTTLMCAVAMFAAHFLRWYRAVPLETIKAVNTHLFVLHEHERAELRDPARSGRAL
ncbi:hypothetical protein BV20DRAFT_420499 [Pilatotrama ljubarskyi]|nr:hypothetical protein BV20DRAFT_420499 [Pilatotrama ljubarskyi]